MPNSSKKNNIQKGNNNNLTKKNKSLYIPDDPTGIANLNNQIYNNNSNVEENTEDKNIEQPVINLSKEEEDNFEFLMNLTNVDLPVILDTINYEMEAKKL